MRAVAGQEQAAVLHRLDHEAAHRRDALLQHLALGQLARAAQPLMQLVPDARIGPSLDLLVVVALQIKPRQRHRAHGVEREAAVGVGVDQFVIRRRRLRQDAEPAERIVALEHAEHAVGKARPADAVETVAAGDEVAFDLLRLAAMREADLRPLRGQLMDADAVNLEQQRPAIGEPALD